MAAHGAAIQTLTAQSDTAVGRHSEYYHGGAVRAVVQSTSTQSRRYVGRHSEPARELRGCRRNLYRRRFAYGRDGEESQKALERDLMPLFSQGSGFVLSSPRRNV
jgi:hypothetical protein